MAKTGYKTSQSWVFLRRQNKIPYFNCTQGRTCVYGRYAPDYGPNCLLVILKQICEETTYEGLSKFVSKYNILTNSQYGFRSSHKHFRYCKLVISSQKYENVECTNGVVYLFKESV